MTLDQLLADPQCPADDAKAAAWLNERFGWSDAAYGAQPLADALIAAIGNATTAREVGDAILTVIAADPSPTTKALYMGFVNGGTIRPGSPSIRSVLMPMLPSLPPEAVPAVVGLLRSAPMLDAGAVTAERARLARLAECDGYDAALQRAADAAYAYRRDGTPPPDGFDDVIAACLLLPGGGA